MNIDTFTIAFQDGSEFEASYGHFVFQTHEPHSLVLTSGKIVACDPFVFNDVFTPFEITVAPGEYPVVLSIAYLPKNSDQRVACAMIRFQERMPVRFSMALTAGQNLDDLPEGDFHGYGVDSGTGCFVDVHNVRMFDEADADQLIAELAKTYVHTWSWADLLLNPATGGNLAAFSSGFGDGGYASYFGYDEGGDLVCLVTDFGLFDGRDG